MDFQHLPGLTPDGTIYFNEDIGVLESMIPPGTYRTAHAPALIELPDGDMLCAWFAGSFEGSADVSIVCSRLPKGKQGGGSRYKFPMTHSGVSKTRLYFWILTEPCGQYIPLSWTVCQARTICSLPRLSAARKVWMEVSPGANRKFCLPGKEVSAVSRFKYWQMAGGSSVTGYVPIRHPDWPVTLPYSRFLMTRE